jgi:hypothetical protein
MEEGRDFQLPETMTDDEIARLGIFVLELPQAPPQMPWYATEIMPAYLTDMIMRPSNGRSRTRPRTRRILHLHRSICGLHCPLHLHLHHR